MATTKLLRFRFGLRTLLFAMTGLVAAVSWWITWPQRTASRFVTLLSTAPDEAEKMTRQSGMFAGLREHEHGVPYLEPISRSLADTLRGAQSFTVVVPMTDLTYDGKPMELTGTLVFVRGDLNGPLELDSRNSKGDEE